MRIFIAMIALAMWLFGSVGVISSLNGKVTIDRASNTLEASVGMELEKKDIVSAAQGAKAQIMFEDKTVITIASNSSFNIEEYFFDDSSNSKLNVKLNSGMFKVISGKIGKIAKDRFKLKTKNATIGIRGTHILANLQDGVEYIACTKGMIFVQVDDVIEDIKEGSMTTVLDGQKPTTPQPFDEKRFEQFSTVLKLDKNLIKKISNVQYDATLASYDQAKEIKDEIASIKNDVQRIGALDLLDDELNAQLDSKLEDEYYKITLPSSYQPSSSHLLGLYTEKDITAQGDKYQVDGTIYETIESAIAAANPVEVFQDNIEEHTPLENVSSYMGTVTDDIYVPWSGEDDIHTVLRYSGKTVGYFYDRSTGEYATIENNDANSVNLLFDFGNRYFVGNIAFALTNDKVFDVNYLANSGATSINPSSFFTDDAYDFSGKSDDFEYSSFFTGRYFGDDAQSITAYLNTIVDVPDINDPSQSSNVVGVIAANQVEKIELTKHPIDENEYLSWGYWAEDTSQITMGGYISPMPNIEQTSAEYISSLIDASTNASYTGTVEGSVHEVINAQVATQLMENGYINLNFDFGGQKITGDMGFDTTSDNWRLNIDNGSMDPSGFTLTEASAQADSSQIPLVFEGSGKFFGNEAQTIGGGFNTVSSEAKTAIGVFQGVKK
jgi:hypothetical protein